MTKKIDKQLQEKTDQERLQMKRYRHIRKLKTKLRKIEVWESRRKRGLPINVQQDEMISNKVEIQRQLGELREAFNRNKPPQPHMDDNDHETVMPA